MDELERIVQKGVGNAAGCAMGGCLAVVTIVWMKRRNRVKFPGTLELNPSGVRRFHHRSDYAIPLSLLSIVSLLCATGFIFESLNQPTFGSIVKFWLAALPFVLLGFASVGGSYVLWQARHHRPTLPTPDPLNLAQVKIYTITLPYSTEWQPEVAYRFIEQMLHSINRLTFRIIAEPQRVVWQIVDLRNALEPSFVEQKIHALYPSANVQVEALLLDEYFTPGYRSILLFRQGSDFIGPICHVTDLAKFDPLMPVSQIMSSLQSGERITYMLVVADFAEFAYKQGEKLITVPTIGLHNFVSPQGCLEALIKRFTGNTRADRYVSHEQKVFQEKLNQPLYQALLLVQIDASTKDRVDKLAALDSQITQLANPPFNVLVRETKTWPNSTTYIDTVEADRKTSALGLLNTWLTNQNKGWRKLLLILEPRELASLWHLPHKGFAASRIVWTRGRQIQLPAQMVGKREGVCLGVNNYAGRSEDVFISDKNRETHINIVGKTRMGKSTLLYHLIRQDIARGRGVAVVDPHGELVKQILQSGIPPERERDVVILDVANELYPPPLNPLGVPNGTLRSWTHAGKVTSTRRRK